MLISSVYNSMCVSRVVGMGSSCMRGSRWRNVFCRCAVMDTVYMSTYKKVTQLSPVVCFDVCSVHFLYAVLKLLCQRSFLCLSWLEVYEYAVQHLVIPGFCVCVASWL